MTASSLAALPLDRPGALRCPIRMRPPKPMLPILGALLLALPGCNDSTVRYDMKYEYESDIASFRSSAKFKRSILDIAGPIDWVMYQLVSDRLFELKDKGDGAELTVLMNTTGGMVDCSQAIAKLLNASGMPYRIIIVQECGSAAFEIIRLATGPVLALPQCHFTVHGYLNIDDGTDIERTYRSRFAFPASWFPLDHDLYHHFSSEEALAYGVISAILDDPGTIFR